MFHDGVNFALYSQHAKSVSLLFFDSPDGPATDVIAVENKTENIWHVFVHEIRAGQLYAYKVDGEYNPGVGLRFNPNKLLIDPYAKALTAPFNNIEHKLFSYDLNAPDKDLVMDTRDNTDCVPKCIVIDDHFDWQNDQKPKHPKENSLIYEVHLKGFTAHGSSKVKTPGTYLGFIEKIPYLKELGVTAVELLPIHEFFIQDYIREKGLTNYWGYDSIGFFAPTCLYKAGGPLGSQVQEFKTLVRELHKAGIEIILDVVYNHTGEGSELGTTLSFKGIDNLNYYYLAPAHPDQPLRFYKNDTGCGNSVNAESPAALHLIIDSLRYWTQTMHVDGFRFDLATVLTRINGSFSKDSNFLKTIAEDPILKDVKLIAEPWDLTTYQVGQFPKGWSEWNGKFRDTARKFIKGDEGQAGEFTKRLTGSADIYETAGRESHESVNFITCHDGFTLKDLFSYNEKHNELNKEENKDGTNENHSWNCGIEGETDDVKTIELRKRMVKNSFCAVLFSWGTPMLLGGDEFMRTQLGNNNAWCQDNETSWFDWNLIEKNADILEFVKKAIKFRKAHPLLGKKLPHIDWFDRKLGAPDWGHVKLKTVSYQLSPLDNQEGERLYFVFNSYHRGVVVHLPQNKNKKWFRLVDTRRQLGKDFLTSGKEKLLGHQDRYYCGPHSAVVLVGK